MHSRDLISIMRARQTVARAAWDAARASGGASAAGGSGPPIAVVEPALEKPVVAAASTMLQDLLAFFRSKDCTVTTPAILTRFKDCSEGHRAFEFKELLHLVATLKGGVWQLRPEWRK